MALQFPIFFPVRIGASIRVPVIRFGCDASIPCEVVFHTCSVIHRMQFISAFNLLEHPFLITMVFVAEFVHHGMFVSTTFQFGPTVLPASNSSHGHPNHVPKQRFLHLLHMTSHAVLAIDNGRPHPPMLPAKTPLPLTST